MAVARRLLARRPVANTSEDHEDRVVVGLMGPSQSGRTDSSLRIEGYQSDSGRISHDRSTLDGAQTESASPSSRRTSEVWTTTARRMCSKLQTWQRTRGYTLGVTREPRDGMPGKQRRWRRKRECYVMTRTVSRSRLHVGARSSLCFAGHGRRH
jgi:hypothetical protein